MHTVLGPLIRNPRTLSTTNVQALAQSLYKECRFELMKRHNEMIFDIDYAYQQFSIKTVFHFGNQTEQRRREKCRIIENLTTRRHFFHGWILAVKGVTSKKEIHH